MQIPLVSSSPFPGPLLWLVGLTLSPALQVHTSLPLPEMPSPLPCVPLANFWTSLRPGTADASSVHPSFHHQGRGSLLQACCSLFLQPQFGLALFLLLLWVPQGQGLGLSHPWSLMPAVLDWPWNISRIWLGSVHWNSVDSCSGTTCERLVYFNPHGQLLRVMLWARHFPYETRDLLGSEGMAWICCSGGRGHTQVGSKSYLS